MKTRTLDFNSLSMTELSKAEMRQTEGGLLGLILGVVVAVVGIYALGYRDGATAP